MKEMSISLKKSAHLDEAHSKLIILNELPILEVFDIS